jgi:hypothetical protein
MSEPPPGSSASDVGAPHRTVIDTYRSIARWLVSTFGAVAGVLLVGVQLTSLGELHGWRLPVAFVCVAVMFIAILAIVLAALRVLTPVRLAYRDLPTGRAFEAHRRQMERDAPGSDVAKTLRERLEGHDRAFEKLEKAEEQAVKAQEQREQRKDEAAETTVKEAAEVAAEVERAVKEAKEDADEWEAWADEEAWEGTALYVRELFKQSIVVMLVAMLIAAAAATGFAYVSSSPTQPAPKPVTNVHVAIDEPKTCVDLYLALDELAHAKPNIGSHWPTTSLGKQDRACGFHSKKELAHFLNYLAHK